MSGYLPVGTSLVLADTDGNIVYPGTVSSSNITTLTSTVATNTSNIATNTSAIATNTSAIATNTSNISTNTTNIATNTSNIAIISSAIPVINQRQTNVLQIYSSPVIYADGQPPSPVPTSSSNTYAQFGWYFKNTTAGYKVNWYLPPNNGMIVSDVLGLYMRYFNCSTTSSGSSPFLIVYTKPTGSNDYAPGFFHSAMVYIINSTPVANTSYTMFMNINCSTPNSYASTIQNMVQSPVNNPRGPYLPTEQILAIVVGSNSISAVNSVEFIAQKLGVITSSGTEELIFQPLL